MSQKDIADLRLIAWKYLFLQNSLKTGTRDFGTRKALAPCCFPKGQAE